MKKVKDLWNPQNMHGELTVDPKATESDIQTLILRAIRKYPHSFEDIQYVIKDRDDGTKLVYFELLD